MSKYIIKKVTIKKGKVKYDAEKGYVFAPKSKTYENIKKVEVVDNELKTQIMHKKLASEYKKIVAYIYQILNEDEGDAINTLTAYSELDRLKHLLMLKYQEKVDKKLLEKYMLKLEILEMEINKLMYNLYQNREVSTERGTSR